MQLFPSLIFGLLIFSTFEENGKGQKTRQRFRLPENSIPIVIKDDGVDELTKGDVTMIFYITVTNVGNDPVHLFVNSTRCCQRITRRDEDCESMRLHGGDMGKLYPRDNRNLTLLFPNLYLHDRVGKCEIEIKDSNGKTINKEVRFNTGLVKDSSRIPRLLQRYYKLEDLSKCDSVDQDPLNQCQPYACAMRYNGARSYYNHTSKRCEKLPKCASEKNGLKTSAYIVENNACKDLVNAMTKDDFTEFHEGKPGVHVLTHAHSYPINVHCHNGKKDPYGRWCKCNTGWDSAPFDHKSFNMDLQVYHMCTVWLGKMSEEQARNITVLPKNVHAVLNAVVFSVLIVTLIIVFALLLFILFRKKIFKLPILKGDDANEEELVALTETSLATEDD